VLNAKTLLSDLHKLHVAANLHCFYGAQDALRLAIVETALELDLPTGLDAKDLLKGPEFRSLLFLETDSSKSRQTLDEFLAL
jgi:hypothetical protein